MGSLSPQTTLLPCPFLRSLHPTKGGRIGSRAQPSPLSINILGRTHSKEDPYVIGVESVRGESRGNFTSQKQFVHLLSVSQIESPLSDVLRPFGSLEEEWGVRFVRGRNSVVEIGENQESLHQGISQGHRDPQGIETLFPVVGLQRNLNSV